MNLLKIANEIRKHILFMNSRSNASHSGTALSVVDILVVLYFKVLNVDSSNPKKKDRDKFILSKGHGSVALYVTLAERGFFDKFLLDKFYLDGGILPGHLDKDSVPGIEVSSGSLGHGLSIGEAIPIAFASAIPTFKNLSGNFSSNSSKTENPKSGVITKILSSCSAKLVIVFTNIFLILVHPILVLAALYLVIYNAKQIHFPYS